MAAHIDDARNGSGALVRWLIANAALTVPQAAGPVAFSLLALASTGDTRGGAALILAMTLAQVIGAIPITRFGRAFPAVALLRWLITIRTLALLSLALLAAAEVPFGWLFPFAALAGSVNGAAYGFLRSLLNGLTLPSELPRALGISATLNEVTFVLAPVAASGLGTLSPVLGIVALTVLGAIPAVLVPSVRSVSAADTARGDASKLGPEVLLWLLCAAAGSAAIAAVEIGAVALALSFGYVPALAILFTVPLCLASVAGGLWVSVRNRAPSRRAVIGFLSIMALGAGLAALQSSLAATIVGTVLIGSVLAPLATYYSLVLDRLAPPTKRPEVFALLRTANAVGVILASTILAVASISSTLIVVAVLMLGITVSVALVTNSQGELSDDRGGRR